MKIPHSKLRGILVSEDTMLPTRLSIVTYNIWNTMRWDVREPALRQFVELFNPDILCLQELRAETQACLDEAMPTHTRVHDDFPGWTCEGTNLLE